MSHTPTTVKVSRWLLPSIALAQLMLILDITVANVALPSIAAEFRLGGGQIPWMITAYVVTLGGLMLVGGRAADVFGPRRVLLTGLTLFTAASLVAASAPDSGPLLAARVAQGLGAALASPSALASLSTAYDGDARRRALQVWAAIGGTGAALGVIMGGVLTSGPGWRWVFLINGPIGILVIVALARLLPRPRRGNGAARADGGWRRLDLLGGLTVTAATASLIYAITTMGQGRPGEAAAWLAAAALLYFVFALIERRRRDPLIDVRALASPRVATGALVMMASSVVMGGLFFSLSFHFQAGLGWTPLATGLAFLPAAVGTVLGAHFGSELVQR